MTYHLDQNILEFTIHLMEQHEFCMKQVEHSSITSRFEFWALSDDWLLFSLHGLYFRSTFDVDETLLQHIDCQNQITIVMSNNLVLYGKSS